MENEIAQNVPALLKNIHRGDDRVKKEVFYLKNAMRVSDDIMDRKKLEIDLAEAREKIEAANKAKTEFLENMRHDIRTPLTGIVSFSKMIEEETDDPIIKEYADSLIASSYALSDLLNEILEITKINSGSSPVIQNKFDLRKRLHDIFQLNRAHAHQKNIELIFEYDSAIPHYVLGDNKRIHRIVLELMNNAINFTHKGSVTLKVILVREIEQDLIIKLIVEDTGIGIDPSEHDVIFRQFKRLTPSCEGIYKGTGVGLSMVKKYIEELHGEVYLRSQVGCGSQFICVLALKKPLLDDDIGLDEMTYITNKYIYNENKPAEKITHHSKVNAESGSRILLIEDQPLAARAVITMFKNLGCSVDIATNGNLALLLTQENKYDLIFMDIGLPDMDGYEVTKKIRSSTLGTCIHTPIIALSAHIEVEHTQQCLSVGMSAVITKPLKKEKAVEILNTFLPQLYSIEKEKNDCAINYFNLSTIVVDFDFVKKNMGGSEKLMREMLIMFLQTLPDEVAKLQKCYEREDWGMLKASVHQMKGGSSYCGTLRLNQICTCLEEAIVKDNKKNISIMYQQMIEEIDKVKVTIENKYSL